MWVAPNKAAPRRLYGSARSAAALDDWDVFPDTPLPLPATTKPAPTPVVTPVLPDDDDALTSRPVRSANQIGLAVVLPSLPPAPRRRRPRNKLRVALALSTSSTSAGVGSVVNSSTPLSDAAGSSEHALDASVAAGEEVAVPADDSRVTKRRGRGAAAAPPPQPRPSLAESDDSVGADSDGFDASPAAPLAPAQASRRLVDLQSRFRRVTMGLAPLAPSLRRASSLLQPLGGRPSLAVPLPRPEQPPPAASPALTGVTAAASHAATTPAAASDDLDATLAGSVAPVLRPSLGAESAGTALSVVAASAIAAAVAQTPLTGGGGAAAAVRLPQRVPQRPPPSRPLSVAATAQQRQLQRRRQQQPSAPAAAAAAAAPLPRVDEGEAAGEWGVLPEADLDGRDATSQCAAAPAAVVAAAGGGTGDGARGGGSQAADLVTSAAASATVSASAVGQRSGAPQSEAAGGGLPSPGPPAGGSGIRPLGGAGDDPSPAAPLAASLSERALACCLPSVLQLACPPAELLGGPAAHVSREWRRVASTVYSWAVALGVQSYAAAGGGEGGDAGAGRGKGGRRRPAPPPPPPASPGLPPVLRPLRPLLDAFPWGCHLADGAYKQVFRVWAAAAAREEAVSVMDLGALAEAASLNTVAAEVQVGCLVADLARTGVCPNMLVTHQVFVHGSAPATDFPLHWGAPDPPGPRAPRGRACPYTRAVPGPAPAASAAAAFRSDAAARVGLGAPAAAPAPARSGPYLFSRMELCTLGDAEEALRRVEPALVALEAAAAAAVEAALPPQPAQTALRGLPVNAGGRKGGGGAKRAPAAAVAAQGTCSAAAGASPAATAAAAAALADADSAGALFALRSAFQMAFSLFAARARLGLRHYDVKLLNFLLQEAPAGGLTYAVGPHTFRVLPPAATAAPPAASAPPALVKLADFGSAETGSEGVGEPVRSRHFTTLENAPPEHVLLGDASLQGPGPDTWGLGLCLLHLLTGGAPWEEVLGPATCPPALAQALAAAWGTAGPSSVPAPAGSAAAATTFHKLAFVCGEPGTEAVLADTLFRACVLLGPPPPPADAAGEQQGLGPQAEAGGQWLQSAERHYSATAGSGSPESGAWRTLHAALWGPPAAPPPPAAAGATGRAGASRRGRAQPPPPAPQPWELPPAAVAAIRAAFSAAQREFGLWAGTHALLRRARRRLSLLPGTADLLLALLAAHPAARPSLRAALLSGAFASLRVTGEEAAAPGAVRCAAFACDAEEGVPDV